MSGDGQHIVFLSSAPLVATDRNQAADVYVLNVATGVVTLESVAPDGAPADGGSVSVDIDDRGRFIVFASTAGNLTEAPHAPGSSHIFLRDRQTGTIRQLTTSARGEPTDGHSSNPAISADGTAVVFESSATDLIESGDTHRAIGIYLIRLDTGRRTRVEVSSDGRRLPGLPHSPAISGDGRLVVFVSKLESTREIYLRDTQANTTTRLTNGRDGGDADGPSYHPAISADGRHVAFVSEATNLVRDTKRRMAQVYLRDVMTGRTELVTRTPSGRPANGASHLPVLSRDGSRIAFQSLASNLECEDSRCGSVHSDINLLSDVFVYERSARRIIRVSTDNRQEWMESSRAPSLDGVGAVMAFGSWHPIDDGDLSHDEDLYVYRLR